MRENGWEGARYGSKHKTTIADDTHRRYPDLVDRRFYAAAPNRLWVADFTYVSTWMGFVYVAFVIDAYSRRILGWRAARSMTTDAGPRRYRARVLHPRPGRHHQPARADRPQRRRQSIHLAWRSPSGSSMRVWTPRSGRSAMRWTTPWPRPPSGRSRTNSSVAKAPGVTSTRSSWRTAEWVLWFNTERPHEYLDDFTPEAVETLYYDHRRTPPKAG